MNICILLDTLRILTQKKEEWIKYWYESWNAISVMIRRWFHCDNLFIFDSLLLDNSNHVIRQPSINQIPVICIKLVNRFKECRHRKCEKSKCVCIEKAVKSSLKTHTNKQQKFKNVNVNHFLQIHKTSSELYCYSIIWEFMDLRAIQSETIQLKYKFTTHTHTHSQQYE